MNFGSTESTGVVYDLIGEGPLELVGGLSGIFLNRTPIANESADIDVQSIVYEDVGIPGNNQFTVLKFYPLGTQLPVIVLSGLAETTGSTNGATVTTTGNFFTTNMINGNLGNGILVPKLRIDGANLDGSEYVGSVVEVLSATQATVFPPVPANVSGKRVSFDFFTTGTVTASEFGLSTFTTASNIPNRTNLTNSNRLLRAQIDSLSDNLSGSNSDNKNFKFVIANFRPGKINQPPVANIPSFTNASLGVNKNTEIKQFTDYFNNSRLGNFWGKHTLKRPTGATGGPSVIINASEVSPGSVNEVDELSLTISAPQGLYAANDAGTPRTLGAVFQIIFKYKNGSQPFKEILVFGPTDAQIAAAPILIADNSGTFRRNGPDPTGTIRAASKSAIDFDFRWSIEQFKPFTDFQVEIKKVTPDILEYNNDIFIASTTIKSLQAFINDKLAYPLSSYAAIAFDSLEFGGEFPERAYRVRRTGIEMPSNYVTREEASDGVAKYTRDPSGVITNSYQIWNGTFRTGYTNNPIWLLRDMLLNKVWGLGHWITPDMINDYSLYSLARYADELVPDGNGGLEPRFTCGVYLTQGTEAYKVIRDFCTIVLAIPYWIDGQMSLEGDRPAEPVYTFTKGNIEGGVFSYEGTGNKTRPNQIAVLFNNKDNFYEQELELVDDVEDMIKKNRIFPEEVVAFGATTRGQATRYGRWKLLTSKLQKEVVSFKTGENAVYLKPGSIINIQDADRNSVRYSGRVVSGTTSSIIADSPITLNSGETYTLHVFIEGPATYLMQESVTLSEGTFSKGDLLPFIISGVTIDSEEKASKIVDTSGNAVIVQFVSGAHLESKTITSVSNSTINVSGNFTSAPQAETVWAVTIKRNGDLVAGSSRQYKIMSIGEESPGVYSIAAAEHYNSKFDLIDEEYLASSPRIVPRYKEVPPITDFSGKIITSRQTSDDVSSSLATTIELLWVGPRAYTNNVLGLYPDFDEYQLEIVDPLGNITRLMLSKSANSYNIINAIEGTYNFTLRAISKVGPISRPSRLSINVSLETLKSSVLSATLPRGGTFSRDINIADSSIEAPSNYRFTAESGISVIYSPTEPKAVLGTYWANGTNVYFREIINGVETWTVIN